MQEQTKQKTADRKRQREKLKPYELINPELGP